MSSRSLNKVLLIGNLTRDPEVRYTSNGAAMCAFGLATNRTWKGVDGEVKEEAEFHNLVAWNKMAEVCYQILAKGMKVYVEGELRTRSWEDEKGETKYRTEIKVNEMILLDAKGRTGAGGGKPSEEHAEGGAGPDVIKDEEIEIPEDVAASEKPAKSKAKEKSKPAKSSAKPAKENKDSEEKDILDDGLPF